MAFEVRQPIRHTSTSGMDTLYGDDLGAYADAKAATTAALEQTSVDVTIQVPPQRTPSEATDQTAIEGVPTQPKSHRLDVSLSRRALRLLVRKPVTATVGESLTK